jgi:hypothetical protein
MHPDLKQTTNTSRLLMHHDLKARRIGMRLARPSISAASNCWWSICLLGPITLIMLPIFVFYGSGQLPGDTALQYLPYKAVAAEAARQGELPLWNPYVFGGAPLLADPQNSLLYPSQIFFLLLPLNIAFAVVQYLHLLLLAIGMFVLLRRRCERIPALMGALAFALSGPVFFRLHLGIYSTLQALAWLPWIWLCVERFWHERRPIWLLAAGGALALQLLAGFPTLSFYTLLALGIYTSSKLVPLLLRRAWRSFAAALLWHATMLLTAALLSAIQLLPSIEFIRRSSRATPEYLFIQQGSLPLVNIVTALLPDIFGSPTTATAIQGAAWGEYNLYIGVFPVLLVLLDMALVRRRRHSNAHAYLVLATIFLLLSFGAYLPGYRLVFTYVPGFKQLADPGRMTLLYTFFLALASAESLQRLSAELITLSERRRRLFRWLMIGVSAGLLAGLLILAFGRTTLSAVAAPWIVARYGGAADEKLAKLDTLYLTQATSIAVCLLICVVGGALIYRRMQAALSARTFMTIALLLVLGDIGIFALRLSTTLRAAHSSVAPNFMAAIKREVGSARIVPLDMAGFVNASSQYGVRAISGYNPLIAADYLRLLSLVRGEPIDPADRVPGIERYDSPLLTLLNTRYVYSSQAIDDPSLTLVLRDNGQYLYALPPSDAAPAFMLYQAEIVSDDEQALARIAQPDFDPLHSVLIHSRPDQALPGPASATAPTTYQLALLGSTLNSLRFEVNSSRAGWLLISQSYDPGWKADVDGRATTLYKADIALQALALEPGRHSITLRYQPAALRYGALITLAGMIAVAVLWLVLVLQPPTRSISCVVRS